MVIALQLAAQTPSSNILYAPDYKYLKILDKKFLITNIELIIQTDFYYISIIDITIIKTKYVCWGRPRIAQIISIKVWVRGGIQRNGFHIFMMYTW
ncbi:hypothetical protein BH18THE1_BH18THE1_05680 [soil metagenome]